MRQILLLIFLFLNISSCYIEKRQYSSGYYHHVNFPRKIDTKESQELNSFATPETIDLGLNTDSLLGLNSKSIDTLLIVQGIETNVLEASIIKKKPIGSINVYRNILGYVDRLSSSTPLLTQGFTSDFKSSFDLDSKERDPEDKRTKKFSWDYFLFITFSVLLTTFLITVPSSTMFVLAYLVGFLLALHFYFWIRWKHHNWTKNCFFQFFYWGMVPQLLLIVGIYLLNAVGITF
jgi:hypothetical protein